MHRFEAILTATQNAPEPWNRALFETKSFVAFPSVGALVAGWLLVVPRRPMLNLRDLNQNEQSELQSFTQFLIARLGVFAGEVFAFEHGNTVVGGLAGCGVDQAHLHLVPLNFDLIQAATHQIDGDILWTNVDYSVTFAQCIPTEKEYVSIWRPSRQIGLAGTMRRPQSQWVRKVIAAKLGKETSWDYKIHPNLPNLTETVEKLHKAPAKLNALPMDGHLVIS